MSEADIQRAILDYLRATGVLAFRQNTGAIRADTRFIRFGVPGMADILACPRLPCDDGNHRPHFLWVEVKSGGGKQSELQKSFEAQVRNEGHFYLLARSLDDVIKFLE